MTSSQRRFVAFSLSFRFSSAAAPICAYLFYTSPKLTHILQRRHSQSILNQLNALSSAHQALTSNHNIRQQEIASTQRELDAAKHELTRANEDSQKKQQEHNEVLEQLRSVRMELKAEREERKHKTAGVRARLVDLGTKYVTRFSFHYVSFR
jgi:septal ring factor EnvC (AmiA/AmiB activator)